MATVPLLIVDPMRERHFSYHEWLGRAFALELVERGEQALDSLAVRRAVLAIVCADLPDMGGVALCHAIRNTEGGRKTRILLAGDDLDDAILGRDTAVQMGADDLIRLPYDASRLKAKLKTLLLELKEAQSPVVSSPALLDGGSSLLPDDVRPEAHAYKSLPSVLETFPALSPQDAEILGVETLSRLLRLDSALETQDYYVLLDLSRDVNPAHIRKTYHALSREFHPDRFVLVSDPALTETVSRVFKRLSEAYRVLKDPALRREYDAGLAAAGDLRLRQTERKTEGPRDDAARISHPQARKFYTLAASAHAGGDLKTARMNLKLALSLAPNDPLITARLADVEKLM